MKKPTLPTHIPADLFIKLSGIPRRTFFSRVVVREVRYLEPFGSQRLYDVADWNIKNDDYLVDRYQAFE